MNFNVVRADKARLDEYRKIFTNCVLFEKYFSGDDGQKRLESNILEALESEDSAFEAISPNGEALGLICVDWKGFLSAFPYIRLLGVAPGARGMGVGSTLLDKVTQTAAEAGFPRVFLCATEGNPRAKKLYVDKGFRKIALLNDLFRNGVSENILMKLL